MRSLRLVLLLAITGTSACALAEWMPWIEPPARTEAGFPVPAADFLPRLPDALGAHPDFAIEWWYWTGHLHTPGGDETFGFQATLFRVAGDSAGNEGDYDAPVFGRQQLYLAHMGLSEHRQQTYRHVERVLREGWQASAATGRLDLDAGPLVAYGPEEDGVLHLQMNLPDQYRMELSLLPEKPLVVFGERGLSRKGSDPAAVSWYWTYPRLRVSGLLWREGEAVEVSGVSWMDHEISSSQLGEDLEGWDWACLHLNDGSEVKAYRLRRDDGSADSWSAVYWIDQDGETRRVYAADFSWQEDGFWTSPVTGLRYPNQVTIRARDPADGELKEYRLRPLFNAQEFVGNRGDNPYWEGACQVLDRHGNVIGLAYLELAGYGGGLGSRLRR